MKTDNETQNAISILKKTFPDMRMNNNLSIGSQEKQDITGRIYDRQSMKRSKIKNINYEQCTFRNNAFSDSYFESVFFIKNVMKGNSLTSCKFFDCVFDDQNAIYLSNNFSQSNFNKCDFTNIIIKNCGLLQTLFHNCNFTNITLKSSTLEGSRFLNGTWNNVNAGNVNVEFMEFDHLKLKNTILPFYQFPYIIGIADYLQNNNQDISLCINRRKISLEEYKKYIDNLILLYNNQMEYFPICNLQIMLERIEDAKETLINGINCALSTMDFRMIRYYCRLAQHHNLLDEFTINRILHTLEDELTNNNIPPEQLNTCIIHIGEIRQILLNEKRHSVTYGFHIKTNINKDDTSGIVYLNTLCNDLNLALAHNNYAHKGFEIAVSNHSPFEILINVICGIDSLCSIAQLIWTIVEKHGSTSINADITKEYAPIEVETYQKYVNTRIDLCKEQLLNLKNKYTGKKLDHHIEEITQNLKTDINELYDKNIMIFIKKNT